MEITPQLVPLLVTVVTSVAATLGGQSLLGIWLKSREDRRAKQEEMRGNVEIARISQEGAQRKELDDLELTKDRDAVIYAKEMESKNHLLQQDLNRATERTARAEQIAILVADLYAELAKEAGRPVPHIVSATLLGNQAPLSEALAPDSALPVPHVAVVEAPAVVVAPPTLLPVETGQSVTPESEHPRPAH